jgi:putative hemolysin
MNSELFFFLLLLGLSGFFSCAEMALFSLSDAKIRTFLEQNKKNAKVLAEIKKQPQKLLIAILISITFVNSGATAMATVFATKAFGSNGAGIAAGVMAFLILFFGEIAPKVVAQKYSSKIVLAIAPMLKVTMLVLTPIIFVMDNLTKVFLKVFGLQEVRLGVSEDEVKALLTLGHEEGAVESGEREMIERVFLLNDITAEDVMTPEEYMVGFDADTALQKSLPLMEDTGYSRYPIFHPETGQVEGIVYIKDIFAILAHQPSTEELQKRIDGTMKPASFVPGTMHIDDLLKFFQKKHQHIAIVVDEYGTVLGLVTLEDLLEEIVGEIIDETDVDSDLIQRIDKNSIMIDPRITIGRVNTFFNSNLKGSRHKTMGWLLLREFGRIPEKGDSIVVNGYKCIVEDADERKMKRVMMIKTPSVR